MLCILLPEGGQSNLVGRGINSRTTCLDQCIERCTKLILKNAEPSSFCVKLVPRRGPTPIEQPQENQLGEECKERVHDEERASSLHLLIQHARELLRTLIEGCLRELNWPDPSNV